MKRERRENANLLTDIFHFQKTFEIYRIYTQIIGNNNNYHILNYLHLLFFDPLTYQKIIY